MRPPTSPFRWLSSDWFMDADDVGYRFRFDLSTGTRSLEHIATGERAQVAPLSLEQRVDDLEQRVRALERG